MLFEFAAIANPRLRKVVLRDDDDDDVDDDDVDDAIEPGTL
jgi:hypothetical protein